MERPHLEDLTESSLPLVALDFAYNAYEGEDDKKPDKALGTSKVMVNRETGMSYGNAMASKEADEDTTKEVNRFVKMLGYNKIEIRSDLEKSVVAIQDRLVDMRSREGVTTLVTNGKS